MSLNVKNRMHRLNSESDMEWFARVYALQESRITELEASLDAMTARAAINGKGGLRYRTALEEVKAFVCGEAVSKWGIDPQTTKSRIRIANTCDVALVNRANACVVDLYDRFKELREDRDKWKAKAEHLISRASHN